MDRFDEIWQCLGTCTYVSGPLALTFTGEEINFFRSPGAQRQEKPRVNRRAKLVKLAPVSADLALDTEREGSLYFLRSKHLNVMVMMVLSVDMLPRELGTRVGSLGFAKSGFAVEANAFTITCARLFVLMHSVES